VNGGCIKFAMFEATNAGAYGSRKTELMIAKTAPGFTVGNDENYAKEKR